MIHPGELERRLWAPGDGLRAKSRLAPTTYREPVLGLTFRVLAEHRFEELRPCPDCADEERP